MTSLVQDLNLLVLTITGSIAEAYYGLTGKDEKIVMNFLPSDLREIYFSFKKIKRNN